MNLTILTPEKELFKGEITSVKVPGINGAFEILKNHAPVVSALGTGKVRVLDTTNNTNTYEIKSGFIEVLNNEISLLVQSA